MKELSYTQRSMDESQKHCAEQKMPHTCPKVKTLLFHSYEILKKENIYGDRSQKEYPAVDVTGDRSKVRCCKEQYCIGTWNVRSMNQGKLEVVKQEMARVNVDILGISKLK